MERTIILSEGELYCLIHECIQEILLEQDLLIEHGELRTYDINVTKRYVTNILGISPQNFKIENRQGVNIAQIVTFPYISNSLDKAMRLCGYFCSKAFKINPWNYMLFQYEPKHETPNLRTEINKWRYIYHVSPYYTFENIKNIGFCPACKSKTFEYPPRNYFFGGNISYNVLVQWAIEFAVNKIINPRKNRNNGHGNNPLIARERIVNSQSLYVIYAIDTAKIPKNVEFYKDPNLREGYFSTDNIPANCIAETKIIDLTQLIQNRLKYEGIRL